MAPALYQFSDKKHMSLKFKKELREKHSINDDTLRTTAASKRPKVSATALWDQDDNIDDDIGVVQDDEMALFDDGLLDGVF